MTTTPTSTVTPDGVMSFDGEAYDPSADSGLFRCSHAGCTFATGWVGGPVDDDYDDDPVREHMARHAEQDAARNVDELLAEHAPTNSLAALAVEPDAGTDLAAQGAARTASAPRVIAAAGRAGRHPIGVALTVAVALVSVFAGVHVAWTTPPFSGGHLIAGPVLIGAGGLALVRLAHVQLRRNR